MFPFTFDAMHRNNVEFVQTFIDLKVTGYKTYAEALDKLTASFYNRQLKQSIDFVSTLGDNMKKATAFGMKS